MATPRRSILGTLAALWTVLALLPPCVHAQEPGEVILRVATFNLTDLRTSELQQPGHPSSARAQRLAEVIRQLRPNIILLNEIAYDGPGAPGFQETGPEGQNGQRFVERFLSAQPGDGDPPHAPAPPPIRYKVFTAPVNSGMPSGFDLDRSGSIITSHPRPRTPRALAQDPDAWSDPARAYAGDSWGFGTFPGQYGMALLVDERLDILHDQARTFRLFPWDYIPAAMLPAAADGSPWYTQEERGFVRLSSRSHWDVPVRLPNGAIIHLLCSHPSTRAEPRGQHRNADEIRFWADYISGREYFVDDQNRPGPLDMDASFILLGTLNADPADAPEGGPLDNPVNTVLFSARRVNAKVTPTADLEAPDLKSTDTTFAAKRLDYLLPSRDLGIAAAGIWRHNPAGGATFPSYHFPVWMEIVAPAPPSPPAPTPAPIRSPVAETPSPGSTPP